MYIAAENNNGRKKRQEGNSVAHDFFVANLSRAEVEMAQSFIFGDNKTYGGYVNHPLIDGQIYVIKQAYSSCMPTVGDFYFPRDVGFSCKVSFKIVNVNEE